MGSVEDRLRNAQVHVPIARQRRRLGEEQDGSHYRVSIATADLAETQKADENLLPRTPIFYQGGCANVA